MHRRTWLILLLVGLLACALVACSSSDRTTGPSEETTTTPEDTASTPEDTPSTSNEETAAEPADVPEPVDEPGQVEPEPQERTEPDPPEPATPDEAAVAPPEGAFSDAATALDTLDSYRYSTLFTFVGEEGGEIEAGSIELMGIVAGPDEKHLIWMNLEDEERFEVIRLGDQAWVYGDGDWTETPILVAEGMTNAILIFAPSVVWNGIFGELEATASYVGMETVNGTSARHYTATYEQWAGYWEGELENATGDVWIAEAGYPVKYHFAASGIDKDGGRGTVTWRMDLADVNEEITIEAPIANGS